MSGVSEPACERAPSQKEGSLIRDGAFYYAPDIRVYVAARGGSKEIYDLSPDLETFNLVRRTSAISTFSCTINNKYKRWDRKLQRMARIKVWLRRVGWLQVFSGYLDAVPYETVVPGAVQVDASCTLKRLEHTYWDEYSDKAQALLPGENALAMGTMSPGNGGPGATNNPNAPGATAVDYSLMEDGGAARGLWNVLTQVTHWPEDGIHIQRIPSEFVTYASTIYKGVASSIDPVAHDAIEKLLNMGSGTGGAGSASTPANASQTPDPELYKTDVLGVPNPSKVAIAPATGNGHGLWDAKIGLPQLRHDMNGADSTKPEFWNGRKVMITGPNGKRAVFATYAGDSEVIAEATAHIEINEEPSKYLGLASGATVLMPAVVIKSEAPIGPAPVEVNGVLVPPDSGSATPGTVGGGGATAPPGAPASNPGASANQAPVQLKLSAGDHPDMNVVPGTMAMGYWIHHLAESIGVTYAISSGRRHEGTTSDHESGHALDVICPTTDAMNKLYQASLPTAKAGGFKQLIHNHDIWNGPSLGVYNANDHFNHIHYANVSNDTFLGQGAGDVTVSADGTQTSDYGTPGESPFAIAWRAMPNEPIESQVFTGTRAFINDTKVQKTIKMLCSSTLREFQSGPNGDFIAWFPDWFGVWGRAIAMEIRDIELRDWKMRISDGPLATHVAVAGNTNQPYGAVDYQDFIDSAGIATVENSALLGLLFGGDPSQVWQGEKFMGTFGMRPMVEESQTIVSHKWEFMLALFKFMKQWTMQYNSPVEVTFMPELYPGMRAKLVDHDIEVYVDQVTHAGSRTGGFTTSLSVSCPMRGGKLLELELEQAPGPNTPAPGSDTPDPTDDIAVPKFPT